MAKKSDGELEKSAALPKKRQSGKARSEASLGRPRDEALTNRFLEAALDLYIASGWAGFNLDNVCKRAKAGKASLYTRWSDRERLLYDAIYLASHDLFVAPGTSLRENLTALGHHVLGQYASSPRGMVFWSRLRADTITFGGIFDRIDKEVIQKELNAYRAVVEIAIAAGELKRDKRSDMLLDMFAGGLINHILCAPVSARKTIMKRSNDVVEQYLSWVLDGIA